MNKNTGPDKSQQVLHAQCTQFGWCDGEGYCEAIPEPDNTLFFRHDKIYRFSDGGEALSVAIVFNVDDQGRVIDTAAGEIAPSGWIAVDSSFSRELAQFCNDAADTLDVAVRRFNALYPGTPIKLP